MSETERPNGDGQTSTRALARQRAQRLRDQAERNERRRKIFLFGSIGLGVIAIVVAVAVIFSNSVRPSATDPLNFSNGGITIGADLAVIPQPGVVPLSSDDEASASVAPATLITVTMDYLCEGCLQFFSANGEQLENWISGGSVELELRPVAVVSTQNSLAAVNAAACVANYAPDSFYRFNAAMFDVDSTGALARDDTALKDVADGVVTSAAGSRVENCIDEHRFSTWAMKNSELNLGEVQPSPNVEAVQLPVIVVNGQTYTGSLTDAQAFGTFVLATASTEATSSPSPSGSPSPSAD